MNDTFMDTVLKLRLIKSESNDHKRAAARLANAFTDMNDKYGDIPEIAEFYESVYGDIQEYKGLEQLGINN